MLKTCFKNLFKINRPKMMILIFGISHSDPASCLNTGITKINSKKVVSFLMKNSEWHQRFFLKKKERERNQNWKKDRILPTIHLGVEIDHFCRRVIS